MLACCLRVASACLGYTGKGQDQGPGNRFLHGLKRATGGVLAFRLVLQSPIVLHRIVPFSSLLYRILRKGLTIKYSNVYMHQCKCGTRAGEMLVRNYLSILGTLSGEGSSPGMNSS